MGGRFWCVISPDSQQRMLFIVYNWWLRIREMGNDGACRIVGIREVWLLTSRGCRMILKEACHVPDIQLNLISIGRLDDEGYSGTFRNGTGNFARETLSWLVPGRKVHYTWCMHGWMGTRLMWQPTQPVGCCERLRAEASMKTENRKKENAGLMEAWSYAQYAGETERESKEQKLYYKKCSNSMFCTCVCVQCTRFIQVLTRTDRSTIVLQCS